MTDEREQVLDDANERLAEYMDAMAVLFASASRYCGVYVKVGPPDSLTQKQGQKLSSAFHDLISDADNAHHAYHAWDDADDAVHASYEELAASDIPDDPAGLT